VYFNRNNPHTNHKRHDLHHQRQKKMQNLSRISIRSTFGNGIHQQSCPVTPKLRGIVCDLHQLLQCVRNSARRTEIFTEWAAQVNVNVRFASSALIMVTFLLHSSCTPRS
jgi:hypothetical protein